MSGMYSQNRACHPNNTKRRKRGEGKGGQGSNDDRRCLIKRKEQQGSHRGAAGEPQGRKAPRGSWWIQADAAVGWSGQILARRSLPRYGSTKPRQELNDRQGCKCTVACIEYETPRKTHHDALPSAVRSTQKSARDDSKAKSKTGTKRDKSPALGSASTVLLVSRLALLQHPGPLPSLSMASMGMLCQLMVAATDSIEHIHRGSS